jgi:hypothetical protein
MQILDLGKLMYQQLHADFGLITFMKKFLIYIFDCDVNIRLNSVICTL